MSQLRDTLSADVKEAMKNKEAFKRDTLRLVMSALKQIEVDERKELSDDDIIKIMQKMVKQRQDAIQQYKAGHRDDLADKEQQEIDIIESYLPAQMDDAALEAALKEIISEAGAESMKDIGKVMGVASKKLSGQADGKRINEMAKKLLS